MKLLNSEQIDAVSGAAVTVTPYVKAFEDLYANAFGESLRAVGIAVGTFASLASQIPEVGATITNISNQSGRAVGIATGFTIGTFFEAFSIAFNSALQ